MFTTFGIVFYYLVLAFLLYRMPGKKECSLSVSEVALSFGFKALMACLYGYIFLRFYGGDDTWMFHRMGLLEYDKMLHHTGQFFKDLTPISAIEGNHTLGGTLRSYNMDLEYYTFYKILAVCNIFSRGNYYINAVLFSFITYWGHYWLFRLLSRELPAKRKLLFLLIFFFPASVFWLSGIRTDGLIFFFVALSLLYFSNWIKHRKRSSFLYFLLAMLGVLVYRNVLVALMAPAFIAWYVSVRYRVRPWLSFVSLTAIAAILFFGSLLFSSTANGPAIVSSRQHEFLALEGNTRFALDSLHADAVSYIRVWPQAAANTFLRPTPWEASGVLQIVTALTILFFWILVAWVIIKKDQPWKKFFQNPLLVFLLFFSVYYYLFIGYTVPFPGAIVRYKSVPELMLLCLMICNLAWPLKWRGKEGPHTTHNKK